MLTPRERKALAERVVAEIKVHGPLPITFEVFEALEDRMGHTFEVAIELELHTRDRDTQRPRIVIMRQLVPSIIEDADEMLRWIYHVCTQLYRHELAEQFRVGGVLYQDPHRGETIVP